MRKRIIQLSLIALMLLVWAADQAAESSSKNADVISESCCPTLQSAKAAESSLKTRDSLPLAELMSGIRMATTRGKSIPAPDFSLLDLSGKELKLSGFRGKVVLLNFFATWCTSCVWEMPEMETLYRAYKEKGFTILAVSLDFYGPEKVKRFAEKIDLTFPIVMDTNKEVARKYGLRGPPVSYLINRKGNIVGAVFGPTSWSDQRAFMIVEHFLSFNGSAAQ